MKPFVRALFTTALLLGALAGCDTHEDPYLLNPPPPDSSSVRAVNLMESDPLDASFPELPVATDLAPLTVGAYRRMLITEQTLLFVKRKSGPHPDTLFSQTLTRGAHLDYFVFALGDTATQTVRLGMGKQEEIDMRARGERNIWSFNAVHPDSAYFIKSGCQSGDVVFPSIGYAQSSAPLTTTADELSLYLFSTRDSSHAIATARLPLMNGSSPYLRTFLVVARRAGQVKLLVMHGNEGDALVEAAPETRTTADVVLMNGLSAGTTIGAGVLGTGTQFASGVLPLTISPSAQVEACLNPLGDSLRITPSGSPAFNIPIRLNVGSRALVVVYNDGVAVRAVVLNRALAASKLGTATLRGVNIAPSLAGASISVGAGAPSTVAADSRPFGTLKPGAVSGWVDEPSGVYPLMLSDATTGAYLDGGLERLEQGYYTVITAEEAGKPLLLVVRDDDPAAQLHRLGDRGARAIFFNFMPDVDATFTIGSQTPRPLGYSYVYSTVVPFTVTSINSNAGLATLDPTLANYLIGTTGPEGNRQIVVAPTPLDAIVANKASVRFLSVVPNAPPLEIHLDGGAAPIETLSFGAPSAPVPFDERQYSVVVRTPGDTITRARSDGVQISKGRRYVFVIGPKRNGSTSALEYQTLWIQE